MTPGLNDPRITAYLLDELAVDQRELVEAALAESAELRRAAAELKETAELLTADLAHELTPASRRTIASTDSHQRARDLIQRAACASPTAMLNRAIAKPVDLRRRLHPHELSRPRRRAMLAVAASILVVTGIFIAMAPEEHRIRLATSQIEAARQGFSFESQATSRAKQQIATPAPSRFDDARSPRTASSKDLAHPYVVAKEGRETALNTNKPFVPNRRPGYAPLPDARGALPAESPTSLPTPPSSKSYPASEIPTREHWHNAAEIKTASRDGYPPGAPTLKNVPGDEVRILQQIRDGQQPRSVELAVTASTPSSDRLSMLKGDIRQDEKVEELRRLAENPPASADNIQEFDVPHNTESYARIYDNPFRAAADQPLSTFSIDVDTASYANLRRFLSRGQLPPPDAVRIEELLNYFIYQYEPPTDDAPFAIHEELTSCPWNPDHRLLRVALKGREIPAEQRPAANLVFLLDVSGSMNEPNKLPLIKESLRLLVEKLTEKDRVAIVVYAGASGLALPSTHGHMQDTILAAINSLQAAGSTNGASGIQLAYEVATENLIREGVNRVILCTDGDFNVGVTSEGELTRLIEEKAKSGVFLSVLGFGMGNYKDATLEKLADTGNGTYGYIDTIAEARKLFVEQLMGTLVTIAKDVKIQIEFNPARVASYRLLGYENRLLVAEDFNDDGKDAGEIGSGHVITALYEIVPVGRPALAGNVDPLKYRPLSPVVLEGASDEMLTLKLRYKDPDGAESKLIERAMKDEGADFTKSSADTQFAAAVALFGMLLRNSEHAGSGTFDAVLEIAQPVIQDDPHGYRAEFLSLVRQAKQLAAKARPH
jgi:Ca-activated chloride channel family protein